MITAASKLLMGEHEVIKSAIEAGRKLGGLWETDKNKYESNVLTLIKFFREYADEYHHNKEEQVLFPEMGRMDEMLKDSILGELEEHHVSFREMVKDIEQAVTHGDYPNSYKILREYGELLIDHIAAENDELFPMAETLFNDIENENVYFWYCDIDMELGAEKKQSLADSILQMK